MIIGEVKREAREKIKGNKWNIWKPLILIALILFLGEYLINFIPKKQVSLLFTVLKFKTLPAMLLSFALSLFTSALTTGYLAYLLKFVRTGSSSFKDILDCVKKKWLTIILTSFLVGLFTTLWSLLFIIPGIIAAYSYAMALYIVVDSDLSATKAIRESKALMHGHKMEFFLLGLSFIGWAVLSVFTLGILYIWLMPYMVVTIAVYYDRLKKLNSVGTDEVISAEIIAE